MAERIHLKRYGKRIKLRYGIDQPVRDAVTENISMTGLFVCGQDVVKPGKVLVIEICLPDDVKIMLKGCVMWAKEQPAAIVGQSKKAGMGIKIVEFLSDGEKVWKKFVAGCAALSKAGECSAMASQDMQNALNIKAIMILIVLSACWFWCSTARANQLTDLRMGEHGAFTRIVFEFKSAMRQTNPIKKDGDRFTIVFPKTAAAQESSLQATIQKNQRVKSLILNAQGQDLCADITMPSADYTTKLRYLPKPERMILDIYAEPVMPPVKPVTAVSAKPEQAALPVAVTAVKQEKLPQMPQSSDMPLYWAILMLINLVMVAILGLMQYALLKIKQRLSARWKNEIPDLSDRGIFVIDAKIQEEIKKYHGLSQPAPTAGT